MGCGASHSASASVSVTPASSRPSGFFASVKARRTTMVKEPLPPGSVDSDGMLAGCDWDIDPTHTDPELDEGHSLIAMFEAPLILWI